MSSCSEAPRRVAVVGTRTPTLEGLALVRDHMTPYLLEGWHVNTGGAAGVDRLAMQVVNEEHGWPERLHVSLPWVGYNPTYLHVANRVKVADEATYPHWYAAIATYHPQPTLLGRGARHLLARNYGVVEDADLVLALPSPRGGGTAYTMRVAEALGVPVVNLLPLL